MGETAELARERMDRLGQLDAASQDSVIEVVRAREEQLSGLPARAVPHHRTCSRPRSPSSWPRYAPQLLAEPGFGALTATKLIGEIAGAQRFASDAKLARALGIAPISVSSGSTNRHGLDRGGNRQITTAIHRRRVTRARSHPETKAYLQRKRTDIGDAKGTPRALRRPLLSRIEATSVDRPSPLRAGAPARVSGRASTAAVSRLRNAPSSSIVPPWRRRERDGGVRVDGDLHQGLGVAV